MQIHKNYSLKNHNTFNIDVEASYFVAPQSTEELHEILSDKDLTNNPILIIGEGSNLLFVNDFKGLVIQPNIKGKQVVYQDNNKIEIKAFTGENWDNFVEWTVENNYFGLENLSLIPGKVGSSAVQNIGAYGVEVSNFISKVETVEIATLKKRIFTANECEFAYRHSIFKDEKYRNKYIITAVYFALSKQENFNTNYGQLADEVKKIGELNIKNIRQAVINIRQAKLPDPETTPNAGSFFKNPIVKLDVLKKLLNNYPEMVYYQIDNNNFKLAAAWLIDKLNWKNKSIGAAAVHKNQALVIVNKGNATGNEILKLANEIKQSVLDNFGVELEFEVNVVGK